MEYANLINEFRQKDYIYFVEQILDVSMKLKKMEEKTHTSVYFRAKIPTCKWYSPQNSGWGQSLAYCVFRTIENNQDSLEITTNPSGDEFVEVAVKTGFCIGNKLFALDTDTSAFSDIENIINKMRGRFINEQVVDRFENAFRSLRDMRKTVAIGKTVFCLSEEEMEDYLRAYYELLKCCLIYSDEFDQVQEREDMIDSLLHLDSKYDSEQKVYYMTSWSPIVLDKIRKINKGIESFYAHITGKSEMLQQIYRRIVLTKAQNVFRWYTTGEEQELLHAALPPYVDESSNEFNFQIVARPLNKYNSFEGIGELRLGEKIIYEYNLIKNDQVEVYNVALLGDLHYRPMEELYRYVGEKIQKTDNITPRIQFNVYTKNPFVGNNVNIALIDEPEAVLHDKLALGKLIDENNIVFLLDCVELYTTPMHIERENYEFIRQRYAFCDYSDYSGGISAASDICDRDMLEDLYEQLTVEQNCQQFGRLRKRANEPLLKYCENKQKENASKSTVYIYVSDLQAFENIYNDDQYYIRTERYNQKEIGIIRYSSEEIRALDVNDQKCMLVFNLWQFIKNIAIDDKNSFAESLLGKKKDYLFLDKILIGIDYSKWPSTLVIHYCNERPDDIETDRIVDFIQKTLIPIMNDHDENMFNEFIKKAMCSFFYSAAKDVNDMLFMHLFQDQEHLLGVTMLADDNNEELVKESRNTRFKYAMKRFYDMIMKNYDISSNSYIGQIKTSQIIQKNALINSRINKERIYWNVIKACNNLSYSNSYLVNNCKREL